MDEYISKKDILQMIESTAMWNRSFSVLYEDIEDMKPADVSPVRHGRWIETGYACGETEYQCSECKETEWRTSASRLKYCPFCGAKMDGGAD